jgi:Tfp pilus assembly protein PilF
MEKIVRINELLQQFPSDNFLRHALALECIKAGDDAKAKELFLTILTESSDYIGSYYHLAKLLERTGEKDKAIKWYEKGMAEAKKINDNRTYNELQSAYEDLLE